MRLAAYIRVSKVGGREGDSFQSPTQQRKAIEAIVSLTPGARIAAEIEDLDVSGGTMDRPGVQQAIEMVESGQVDGIVCAYLDRWARTVEALQMIERWAAEGKTFISARERFDATTSQGKFAVGMMLLVAKYYRDQITERWDESVSGAIARGVHVSVPYGYRKSNGKGSPLAIELDEANVVRRIFDLRPDAGDNEIARRLNADGIPSASGGRWTRQSVRALAMSRTYMGMAYKGQHELADAHPAIVSADDWRRAQRTRQTRTANGRYLLSGLARCASCGYALIGGTDAAGRRYRCAKNHSALRCPSPTSAPVEGLDDLVVEAFLARYGALQGRAVVGKESAATETTLANARAEYEAWRDDSELRAAIGDADYRAGLLARKSTVDVRERAHDDALRASSAATLNIDADIWSTLGQSERRDLLRAGIDAVVVHRAKSTRAPLTGRVELVWAGELIHDGGIGAAAEAVRSRGTWPRT